MYSARLILPIFRLSAVACCFHLSQGLAEEGHMLTFYQGSTIPCLESLAAKGLCQVENKLTRCIEMRKTKPGAAKCVVKGKALFRENLTQNTKEVTEIHEVIINENPSEVTCFTFDKDMYNLWKFQKFSAFNGECAAVADTYQCNPNVSDCTKFVLDNEKCESGWSCNKIAVAKSSFTPCTADIEKQGKCKLDPTKFWGCFTYENLSLAALRCDIRLDAVFDTKVSSIIREEILYPKQWQQLCFEYQKAQNTFKNLESMAVVCRNRDDEVKPQSVCDVQTNTCREETQKTLIFDRTSNRQTRK